MARATRSSAAQEKDKSAETPPPVRKAATKKRKRTSTADGSDEPAAKVSRTEDGVKEEEDNQDGQDLPVEEVTEPELPSSGDVPIRIEDAEKILEVLETVDTQGLLDRIFPLPAERSTDSAAGPSTGTQSYSFRALLKSPSKFPLRVLRTAVHHLFPISSHPRSRPSAPAAEQLRFCNLALSLLDQASFQSAPVPLNVESLIPVHDESSDDTAKLSTDAAYVRRRYALVQRLPTGDYWSSLSSTYPSQSLEGKDVKDVKTGHAELVAIFPSPATAPSEQQAKLGDYVKKRSSASTSVLTPSARRVSAGKFLNYGPNASFAPTFDQEGVEVGQSTLGEVVWYQEVDRRRKERVHARRKRLRPDSTEDLSEVVEIEKPESPQKPDDMDLDASLNDLLSPEEAASVKRALGSLELEKSVDELLARNSRALARLEELQTDRLLGPDGATKSVDTDSEEWETAQSILNSLALLASLRPRSSSDTDVSPLVPSEFVLRKLHRTLPMGPTIGWSGTLPEGRSTALRDDTTLHVRAEAVAAAAAVPVASAAATPVTPVAQKTAGTAYSYAYPYTTAQSSYRGAYGTYTPGTTNYYPNYQTTTPVSATSHYPNQQYPATGTQSYPYSSWYNYQPAQSAAASGPATPATPTTATPAGYSGFFSNAAAQQLQPQRAVANTVIATKGYPTSGWSTGGAAPYVAPLPSHLRSTMPASSPGTPQPAPTTPAYPGYYANYQAAQPAAR